MTQRLAHPIVSIILGAVLLLLPALLNGFPFIFPDSTDYLTLAPQIHRLPFYGLLITFFHLNHFIWMPIIMQSLVVSHLIWLLITLTSGNPSPRIFLLFMGVITAFTSLPFFTGFIMADIFTPIMFLVFYVLTFHHRQLSGWMLYYLFLLACVSIVTHISNLSLGFGLFILFALVLLLLRTPRRERMRSLGLIGGPLLLAIVAIVAFNVAIFGNWALASAGQSFFMANLIEHGPARNYLSVACPKAGYKICAYAHQLPNTADELLWSTGIYKKLGGFVGMQDEAATIVHETIATRPGEVLTMIEQNFLRGLMTHEPAAEFYSALQVQPSTDLLRLKFGEDTAQAFRQSAEMRDTIPHTAIAAIDRIMTPVSFLLLLLIAGISYTHRASFSFAFATATIGFILGDVLLCTALSGVHDRYQSRVTWLAPLVLGILLTDYLKKRRA